MKYWKEAATLILAARFRTPGSVYHPAPSAASRKPTEQEHSSTAGFVNPSFDYQILMLQRTHRSSFFAGAQVFPGGGIDDADFSPKWMELFAEVGICSPQDFGPMVNIQNDRPPMLGSDRGSIVPSDIAFRICAIRETFEESGVLLLKHFSHCQPASASMPSVQGVNASTMPSISVETSKEWRHRVHNNAAEFLEMCRELRSIPDVWSLAEWSNWLTPSDMRRKRYDTIFYLCCMDSQPAACHDDKETIELQWVTPSQSLSQFSEGKVFLPPPQVYEFQRLCHFPQLSALFNFNQQRALLGCQRYLPVRMNCSDGVITTLPGDYLYPDPLVLETIQDERIPQLDGTMEENADEQQPLNRLIFALSTSPMCQSVCSLTLPHGHCSPLPYEQCLDVHSKESKL